MRRFLALLLVLTAVGAATARAGSIGIGAFGGMSTPVLQEDTGGGSLFGVRVPVKLVPLITVEPFYASSSLGDKTQTIAGIEYTRSGFDVTSYGANAMLTMGGPVSFYPFAGIGQTKLKRDPIDDSFTSYDFGFGIGISPMPKVTIDLRGELQAVVDGEASRKFGNATVGVSYALFSMP